MFLRKLMVIVIPLVLLAIVCIVTPLMDDALFWTHVIRGMLLGISLALLLPLSGAGRKKEPFAGLLWVPAVVTVLVVVYQYLSATMPSVPVLSLLSTTNGHIVQVECTFAAYMLITCIRTKK